jgi:redox-sensitive bicupin YhaK (pirin superfamily)
MFGDDSAVEVTVIAGSLGDVDPPSPPPASWASDPDADVAIWHVVMESGGRWVLPAAQSPDVVRTLYVFDGDGLAIDGHAVGASTGVVVDAAGAHTLTTTRRVEALVLQGRPIREPVAQYGPFVMNNRAEIQQAFDDYQRTRFGGWPWDRDDPVHGTDPARFARHADGAVEAAVVR